MTKLWKFEIVLIFVNRTATHAQNNKYDISLKTGSQWDGRTFRLVGSVLRFGKVHVPVDAALQMSGYYNKESYNIITDSFLSFFPISLW